MGLWTCPEHGLSGPIGCCPKSSYVQIMIQQSTAREMCSGDLCDGLSYEELAACFENDKGRGMSDLVPATREDLDTVYEWMNAGGGRPEFYTYKVDTALSRVLDSAELLLTANDGRR